MKILQSYYNNIIRQELLTKFNYSNSLEIPYLKRIVLHFNVTQTSLKNLLPLITGLFFISSKKPFLRVKKSLNITLKVKSGVTMSCKVDLRGKDLYYFLERLLLFILPSIKEFGYLLQKNTVHFIIENVFLFKEIEKDYEYFQDLPKLNVVLFFSTKAKPEILAFLKLIKFPLKS